MLHIIVLSKGYFPEKLSTKDTTKDRVIVIASADDSIPVSAYQNEMLRNMEVKLLPEIKDTSAEGKNILRIAQAMRIGQLTAAEKEYEIYTDDDVLKKGLAPSSGAKASSKKQPRKKVGIEVEIKEKKSEPAGEKAPKKQKEKKEKKTAKAPAKKKEAVKIPTLAQIKKVLGAANSGYAKTVLEVCKNSNQITFEMNARMELAKAGLGSGACQEIAKTLNDEFGKQLPPA